MTDSFGFPKGSAPPVGLLDAELPSRFRVLAGGAPALMIDVFA